MLPAKILMSTKKVFDSARFGKHIFATVAKLIRCSVNEHLLVRGWFFGGGVTRSTFFQTSCRAAEEKICAVSNNEQFIGSLLMIE